ncbi:MAG: hypothetical protein OEV06_10400, partial [Anaerolineae bacterium]|nr:hypothetical protein [Anaerolineae bacterium]
EAAVSEIETGEQDREQQGLTAIEMLEALNEKASASLQEGWLHIRVEEIFDEEISNGVLPNGITIPNKQINDLWFHLDNNHMVYQAVSIMQSIDGEIVQIGVGSNGTAWNSATDAFDESSTPSVLTGLDSGFLRDVTFVPDFGKPLEVEVTRVSDTEVVFTAVERFDIPITNSVDYEIPIVGTEITAVFDPNTGYLVTMETVIRFEDGSERVFRWLKQEISFEEPPAEILRLLAEKAEKEGGTK